ncbi:hypothetical protein GCM10010236_16540 [Streptomyces eurythermus]|nr:hypothetical protein GCM10010236_16540 [Streptomyces eurythermus]
MARAAGTRAWGTAAVLPARGEAVTLRGGGLLTATDGRAVRRHRPCPTRPSGSRPTAAPASRVLGRGILAVVTPRLASPRTPPPTAICAGPCPPATAARSAPVARSGALRPRCSPGRARTPPGPAGSRPWTAWAGSPRPHRFAALDGLGRITPAAPPRGARPAPGRQDAGKPLAPPR